MENAVEQSNAGDNAVASLQNLKSGLQNVQQGIRSGGGNAFMKFTKHGEWLYGVDSTEVEEDARWAINPFSIMHGFISWGDEGKPLGEVMVPMTQAKPALADLPHTGEEWTDNFAMTLACVSGEDEGTQVEYKTNSDGGAQAFRDVISEIMAQLDKDPKKPVPVVELNSTHYKHATYGKIFKPALEVVGWETIGATKVSEENTPDPDNEEEAPKAKPKARTRKAKAKAETEEAPAEENDGGEVKTRRRRRR